MLGSVEEGVIIGPLQCGTLSEDLCAAGCVSRDGVFYQPELYKKPTFEELMLAAGTPGASQSRGYAARVMMIFFPRCWAARAACLPAM